MVFENKVQPLCAFAPLREMGRFIQAAVLAKAQRRKGREGEHPYDDRTYFSDTISLSVA